MRGLTMAAITRFWAHVDRSGDCWIWTGYRVPFGYGRFGIGGTAVNAHRVAWEIAYDAIPEGKHVLHRCDNPPCVRPSHLFVGSNADNAFDRHAKGRTRVAHGVDNGLAKLTDERVVAIKDRYSAGDVTLKQLADEHGVSFALIGQIVNGRIWQHTGASAGLGYARGERTNKNKLGDDQVREIRRRRDSGERLKSLAGEFGCSEATISLIASRKIWRHVE